MTKCNKPYPTIGDLIKDKDYDYISYRLTMIDKSQSFFAGCLNQYAYSLYLWCRKKIIQETGQSFDVHKWKDSIRGYWNLSAQGWIDLYEYLVENG